MQKSTVTKISKFGILKRRWQHNDHLVVVGHNEATQGFFLFNQRQLRAYADQLSWGAFGTHDPIKRAEYILRSIDDSWSSVSECWYHGTLSIEKPVVVHYHMVGLRSFKVPEAVMGNQADVRLGYYEFSKEKIETLGHSKCLQSVIAELLDTMPLQRVA